MKRNFLAGYRLLAGVALAGALSTQSAQAISVYALTSDGSLIGFDSSNPSALTFNAPITGPGALATDPLENIDFRPATNELYAVARSTQLYKIYRTNDAAGQAAVAVATGAPSGAPISGTRFGLDFNPTVDRIRFTTDDEDSIRLHPDTGVLVGTDSDFNPAGNIVDTAYDRSFAGSTSTTLYAIDSSSDELVLVGGINSNPSPNGGIISTVGPLGSDISPNSAIDYSGTTLYGALTVGGTAGLYTINPATGAATMVGPIASNPTILGVAVELPSIVQPKLAIKLSFSKPQTDSISLQGALEIPAGFSVEGATVRVDVGGVTQSLVLDAKGVASVPNGKFQMKVKSKKGVVDAQLVKFTLQLKKGSYAASFQDEGLTNDNISKEHRSIFVAVRVKDIAVQSIARVLYSAKAGKTGSAK